MENYIMRKITFITLMMILGMSSVSFGKSYLCTPYHYLLDDLKSRGKGEFRIIPTKVLLEHTRFMVKTEGDEIQMKSVKLVGSKEYLCDVGKGSLSMKYFGYRICYNPLIGELTHPKSFEFSLDLRKMTFKSYSQKGGTRIFSKGTCEEI